MAACSSLRGPGLAPLLALTLGGCGDTSAPTSGADVNIRDSAGIRIVEYVGTPSPPMLTLADEPVYTHGTRPGDYMFASIDSWMGGVLFPDGTAAVSDWENKEIVMLSRDGAHHDVIARAGEGPGEIGWSARLYAGSSGTFLVDDRGNRRLTLFADGALVRTVRVPSPGEGADLRARGLDAATQVLMSSGASSGRGFNAPWKPGHMARFDLETRRADTVASFDHVRSEPPRQDGSPFFRHFGVVGAAGGEFVHGRNDIPELFWRRPDGSVRQIMRWEPEWTYTTEESRERFLTCWESLLRDDPNRPEAIIEMDLARWRFNHVAPEPLFTTIFGDDEGRAWLWHWEMPCHNRLRFTVIGPDGTWLGVFEPPDGFDLLGVAGDHALVVVKDETDVESVAVYELVGW
ncbi:MAG: hypothetical protein OXL34_17265 [Gemmatimonadota bacterium]|nr:hypothetical protein [Gemmatimonadota bacterium]